jgi:hypothetical protein
MARFIEDTQDILGGLHIAMTFVRLMQGCLFPKPEEASKPLTGNLRQLIAFLELVPIEALVGP